MEKENLNPKESLQIIQEMIQAEKLRFSENGFIYRFWGWLVSIAALAHFILLQLEMYDYHYYPWFLTIFGGIFTGFYYGRKKEKTSLPVSGKILSYTWITISFFIFGIAFFFPVRAGDLLLFIILSHIAVGTIVAGAIFKFKTLLIGGFICGAMAFVSLVVPREYGSLITIVAVVAADLIPGYQMKRMYNKENKI
ncbi:MAG: hypothetical protein JEZ09_15810 [Salinivirgaceae bacterium]|nr:hypothetical protein [Salinivirgaceae bacterium]